MSIHNSYYKYSQSKGNTSNLDRLNKLTDKLNVNISLT